MSEFALRIVRDTLQPFLRRPEDTSYSIGRAVSDWTAGLLKEECNSLMQDILSRMDHETYQSMIGFAQLKPENFKNHGKLIRLLFIGLATEIIF